MKIWTKGKRLAAALLAVVLLLSIVPSGVIPVHSEESEPVDYGQYIGYFAEVRIEDFQGLTISSDPETAVSEQLYATDLSASIVLQIVDYYQDGNDLWYQVTAAPGYTLPQRLVECPWIYQNTVNGPESANALTLTKPTFSNTASSVVSDDGVTVSSSVVDLTELTATSIAIERKESYIDAAVTYDIDLKTASGRYSGYATVAIPIPEGWDESKIFGFVVESDDSVSMIPGTVNGNGTFSFTVPHFSFIGIAQVTDTTAVESVIITFGKIQEENTVRVDAMVETEGRYTSDDGAVEYVIDHVTTTAADNTTTTTTYITFKGLDVTDGTNIKIGNCSYTVKVNAGSAQVEKLLTGGTAAFTTLNPLYDLGVTGPYTATYEIASGESFITCSDGTITAKANATGTATVVATVEHNESENVVATVTYTVTVSSVAVDDVKMLYVPQNGTVTITNYVGSVATEGLLDETIATVATTQNANNLVTEIKITAVADEGETYFIADTGNEKVLFVVYAEPENPDQSNQVKVWYIINSNTNCTVYYAVNGGTLHCLPAGTAVNSSNRVLLIGLDMTTHQGIPGKLSLIFFGAPDAGYATARIEAASTSNQFYCLSNGTSYDGSDSDAWPLDAAGNPVTDKFGKQHGLYAPLANGNMDADGLRDLYARALALGCDSVFSFTKTGNETYATNITFIAEKLPTFHKTVTHYKRANESQWQDYTDDVVLNVGDSVRYQFLVEIGGQYITYDFTITDPYITKDGSALAIDNLTIGGVGAMLSASTTETAGDGAASENSSESESSTVVSKSTEYVSLDFTNITKTVSFTVEYTLNDTDILSYADGLFTNRATLDYTYDSDAASGENTAETTSSVTCSVGSIVTWKDSFGNVLAVQEVEKGNTVRHPTNLPNYTPYYSFDGWYIGGERYEADTYTAGDEKSVTFIAMYIPAEYTITYDLGGVVTWPAVSYTFDDVVDIPMPEMPGYEFIGWEVTSTDGTEENWPEKIDCSGEYVITEVYGNVTLKPRWSRTTLTITVTGCQEIDEGQTFLFTITDGKGMSLDVVVAGNGSVTIEGLDANTEYTITQKLDWSWRYVRESISFTKEHFKTTSVDDQTGAATVVLKYNQDNEITFNQKRNNGQWLDGNGDNFSSQN